MRSTETISIALLAHRFCYRAVIISLQILDVAAESATAGFTHHKNSPLPIDGCKQTKHDCRGFGYGLDMLSDNAIAEKLVARMKREVSSKVVNFQAVIAGRAAAEELQRTVVSKENLSGFHPAHAAYVYTQNQVSVMSEQLTEIIYLAGLPDVPESRPHSKVNGWGFGR